MSSTSRIYVFTGDKVVSPVKLEVELANIVNLWNNHEQGVQEHTEVWTGRLRLFPAVKTSSGDYDVTDSDTVIVINKTVGAATQVNFPASPATGRVLIVKDGKGDAAAHNITVSGNGKNIDSAASVTITTNYGVARYIYNGTEWNAI